MSAAAMGPCTSCDHQPTCRAFPDLRKFLYQSARYLRPHAFDAVDVALDGLVAAFIKTLGDPKCADWVDPALAGVYLSALFDLAVNGIYVAGLVDRAGHFNQRAIGCGPETAYFPFVWMCPGCVANTEVSLESCYLPGARREENRDYPIKELLAKPGGRVIGDAGIKVLLSILRATLSKTRPTATMREGGGAHGEFDLTITDRNVLLFAEVKAKPLISYPLRVHGNTGLRPNEHEWMEASPDQKLDLYLAASHSEIPLSTPNSDATWPLGDLTRAVADPRLARIIVENWLLHLKGYRKWEGEDRRTRWHRFGCGNFSVGSGTSRLEKRVANTKELPGLDRTDDIKKGAAQLIKFSRFKFDCPKGALRAVLMGNTYAETHAEDYIEPLVRLHITRADESDSRAEWIFDAVIGLTVNRFNAADLKNMFAFETLFSTPVVNSPSSPGVL